MSPDGDVVSLSQPETIFSCSAVVLTSPSRFAPWRRYATGERNQKGNVHTGSMLQMNMCTTCVNLADPSPLTFQSPDVSFQRSNHIAGKASIYDMDIDVAGKLMATAGQDRVLRSGQPNVVLKFICPINRSINQSVSLSVDHTCSD